MSPSPDVRKPVGFHSRVPDTGHAVVVGASMAGLLAARVLANPVEQPVLTFLSARVSR